MVIFLNMIRSGVCNGYSVGIFCYGQVMRGRGYN